MRLTKTTIDGISPPAKGQAFYRDDKLKGFAVRVTPSGVMSFIVETRVNGRMRRETLGRYGPLTVEQARREAQKYLGQVGISNLRDRGYMTAAMRVLKPIF